MDVTPANDTPKRRRPKVVVKIPAAEKAPRKTLSVRKKAKPETPIVEPPKVQLAPLDLQAEIAKAAFYLAAERNFAPGYELDDWLKAEQLVKSRSA